MHPSPQEHGDGWERLLSSQTSEVVVITIVRISEGRGQALEGPWHEQFWTSLLPDEQTRGGTHRSLSFVGMMMDVSSLGSPARLGAPGSPRKLLLGGAQLGHLTDVYLTRK